MKDASLLQITAPDFSLGDIKWGKHLLGRDTPTYQNLVAACRQSLVDGYICYDEMFVWANDLLDKNPSVIQGIRDRFPILFIDEAQDTGETQSSFIHRVFMAVENPVVRQRFGDENQAIYDSKREEDVVTDRFPNKSVRTDVLNSHRFSPSIAHLADPLGLVPYNLKGDGPKKPFASGQKEGPHTIFLFESGSIKKVLPAFGDLILQTFDDHEVRFGQFVAAGYIHRDGGDSDLPRHVGHYWDLYDPAISRLEPLPRSFAQSILAGVENARLLKEARFSVHRIASAFASLVKREGDPLGISFRLTHRAIIEQIKNTSAALSSYKGLVSAFAVERQTLTEADWNRVWKDRVAMIGGVLVGGLVKSEDAISYLEWDREPTGTSITVKSRNNLFSHTRDGRNISIRVGSIHSIKGETHTATLALETFWHEHNLHSVLPWLIGKESGKAKAKKRQVARLKPHYVAMSRPTHLLCLAMRRESFCKDDGTFDAAICDAAKRHGWRLKVVE